MGCLSQIWPLICLCISLILEPVSLVSDQIAPQPNNSHVVIVDQLANQKTHQLLEAQSQKPIQTSPVEPSSKTQINSIEPLMQVLASSNLSSMFSTAPVDQAPLLNHVANPMAFQSPKIQTDQTFNGLNVLNEEPVQLDYLSIGDEILRKPTANFVYFNANFNSCRNCARFLNIWKELALDIRWWRQVIRLFFINCSDEDNIEVCRRAGVTQFPQVKFYWVMSNSLYQDGQRLRILGKSVHAMRHMITDKVIESYDEHNRILIDKRKQRGQNPLATFAQSTGANGMISSLMAPLLNQFLGAPSSSAPPQAGTVPSGGGSSLAGIVSSLIGAKGTSDGNPLSGIANIVGGLPGLSQILGSLGGQSSSLSSRRLSIAPLPNNWPELDQLRAINTQQLLDMLPLDSSKSVGALLIMETQEFLYTGIEVMLDLNIYSNQTYIARVTDESSQLTRNLTGRDDIVAPALIYIAPTRDARLIMTAPMYTDDEDLRRIFVKAYDKLKAKYHLKRVFAVGRSTSEPVQEAANSQEDEEILAKSNQVYTNDLINTVRASLMDQVFRHPDLSDDQYNALVKYVYILINYYPFSDDSLKFFKRLHTWLQNQVSPIDVGEYRKQFHDIDEVFAPSDWMACRSLSNIKSIPNDRKSTPSLFENPAQLGKMVSNITRIFRNRNPIHLKNLLGLFSSSVLPATSNKNQKQIQRGNVTLSATTKLDDNQKTSQELTTKRPGQSDSPIERLIKSLTSGSLGSDSSILRLISAALTGAGGKDKPAVGSSKLAREYPCGAWKLAHVLVVSEYVKDSPRKDVKHIVLHTLYQYLLQFYACSTCGNRVSDVSSEFRLILDNHLSDQDDSVLLLWKIHNRVNKRLEAELRPGSPAKVQFPSESLCPKCRAAKAQNGISTTPNWQEKNLLAFLVHHYRSTSLIFVSNSSDTSSSTSSLRKLDNLHLYLTTSILLLWITFLSRLSREQRFNM